VLADGRKIEVRPPNTEKGPASASVLLEHFFRRWSRASNHNLQIGNGAARLYKDVLYPRRMWFSVT